MSISPYAGKPAESWMLTNIPRLITAYYSNQPDLSVPEQPTQELSNQLKKGIIDQ
jgi:phosphoglucomutase